VSLPLRTLFQLFCLTGLLWAVGALPIQCGGTTVVFRSDPQFLFDNVRHLSGLMRGRVSLDAAPAVDGAAWGAGGEAEAPRPLDGLRVTVQAQSHDGSLAIRRVAEVSSTGTFEILGLPEGTGSVAVQLGSGAEIWRAEGVVFGEDVPIDPRLDPIQLGASLHWFDLRIFDDEGAPATAGHLVWREAGAAEDATRAFTGDAVIERGRAIFPATGPCLDVVPLVPGAATELFEGLFDDEEIHLGPGVLALFESVGPMPDPATWSVRLSLQPRELRPSVGYDTEGPSIGALAGPQVVEVKDRGAELALARGGVYAAAWWLAPVDPRRAITLRLEGSPATVEVPSEPGRHPVKLDFPMEAFLEREASSR